MMSRSADLDCDQFRDLRITVMGLGRFGGGAGVAAWLAERGAKILVTDLESEQHLAGSIGDLRCWIESGTVTLRLGKHVDEDFASADLVIVNPAVPRPWSNRYLAAARASGVRITTEIGLLVKRLNRSRVIGVTGTAGKSTTAAMVHHVLAKVGLRSHLGGNIGGSLLASLDRIQHEDWVVLELSSFMLYWLLSTNEHEAGGWSPHIGVLTNFAANHLDWHETIEHYEKCKLQIARDQTAGDIFIDGRNVPDPTEPYALQLPGQHNQRNAELACRACEAAGISPYDSRSALADFAALAHRLQLVAEHEGRMFYDDSKSTTPQSTVLAVESFPDRSSIHLIAGGYDKGSDLSAIAHLAPGLGGLYTTGTTGPRIAVMAREHSEGRPLSNVFDCGTLERAVEQALAQMKDGDILLLSPGCASWDQFENFEQRGRRFTELVCAWPG